MKIRKNSISSTIPNQLRKKIISRFIRAHKNKHIYSLNSASTYAFSIVNFTKYLGDNDFLLDLDDTRAAFSTLLNFADTEIAIDYLKSLVRAGCPRNSVETHIKSINIWLNDCKCARYLKEKYNEHYKQHTKNLIRIQDITNGKEYNFNHLSRTYNAEQLDVICQHLTPRNAFSIRLLSATGMRVKELLTLRRSDEGFETIRELNGIKKIAREHLHAGNNGIKYIVIGKGKHARAVKIPKDLAIELERYRLEKPMIRFDRDIKYDCIYDIAGGNALSKAFARASKRWLGFNTGVHSLRHDWSKNRLKHLTNILLNCELDKTITDKYNRYDIARAILSQEIGHYRPSITEVYLY